MNIPPMSYSDIIHALGFYSNPKLDPQIVEAQIQELRKFITQYELVPYTNTAIYEDEEPDLDNMDDNFMDF